MYYSPHNKINRCIFCIVLVGYSLHGRFYLLAGNGQVQVFGPDALDLFSTYYKIFSVMKYMNLPPYPG